MTTEGVAGVESHVEVPILRSQLYSFSYVVCRLGLVVPQSFIIQQLFMKVLLWARKPAHSEVSGVNKTGMLNLLDSERESCVFI